MGGYAAGIESDIGPHHFLLRKQYPIINRAPTAEDIIAETEAQYSPHTGYDMHAGIDAELRREALRNDLRSGMGWMGDDFDPEKFIP